MREAPPCASRPDVQEVAGPTPAGGAGGCTRLQADTRSKSTEVSGDWRSVCSTTQ